MGVILAMLAQVPAQVSVMPPTDWSGVPELTLRDRGDGGSDRAAFVRGEVAAGRCKAEQTGDGGVRVVAPVVLLVDAGRAVRQIVPRAIGCATVEQYTVGYVSALVRAASPVAAPGWYRVTVTYQWPK